MNVHPRSLVSKPALLAAHHAQLFETMVAIYLVTGSFADVAAATSRAQKKVARTPEFAARIAAEGWVV